MFFRQLFDPESSTFTYLVGDADREEVLVIDNAPRTEATRSVVEAFPGVRYVREDRPGLDVSHPARSTTPSRGTTSSWYGRTLRPFSRYSPLNHVVEISGDFTDWKPIELRRSLTNGDAWEGMFRMSRGIHRINVRRDGGAWTAPAGTTRSADDFDGEVGVFLLP